MAATIGKKKRNAADRPRPCYHNAQGVMQSIPNSILHEARCGKNLYMASGLRSLSAVSSWLPVSIDKYSNEIG